VIAVVEPVEDTAQTQAGLAATLRDREKPRQGHVTPDANLNRGDLSARPGCDSSERKIASRSALIVTDLRK
jgi:hypothetical protein